MPWNLIFKYNSRFLFVVLARLLLMYLIDFYSAGMIYSSSSLMWMLWNKFWGSGWAFFLTHSKNHNSTQIYPESLDGHGSPKITRALPLRTPHNSKYINVQICANKSTCVALLFIFLVYFNPSLCKKKHCSIKITQRDASLICTPLSPTQKKVGPYSRIQLYIQTLWLH